MNKTTKGCLILAIIFILGGVGSVLLIINNINNTFQSDKNKVDISWGKYTELLYYRNRILLNKGDAKSILLLINKSEKNLKAYGSKKDLLTNEYILNDSLRKYKYIDSINQKLNGSILKYNANAKEFNTKYSSFPYSYLRMKKGVSLYDFFEIEYGIDNNETINKNQKIDNWIKNGGELNIE